METKRIQLTDASVKFVGDGMRFAGYASVFGGVDSYGDTIDPKAYDKTIRQKNRERPIRMRWNHYGPVIGKWIEISTDDKGLLVEGELTPGHSTAMDAWASMQHGAVDGMSIGYRPKKIEIIDDGKGRLLKEIDLIEISIVEEPADLGARVDPESIKSAIQAITSISEFEDFLRDVGGLSRVAAKSLISQAKPLFLRDARSAEEAEAAKAEIATILRPDFYRLPPRHLRS